MTPPSPLNVWNKETTQGLPLLGKFGHPNAAIVRAAARAERSDDHLDARPVLSQNCDHWCSLFHEPPPCFLALFNLPLWRMDCHMYWEAQMQESRKFGRKVKVAERESH